MDGHFTLTLLLLITGIFMAAASSHAIDSHKKHGDAESSVITFHSVVIVVGICQTLFCAYLLLSKKTICTSRTDMGNVLQKHLNKLRASRKMK